MENALLVGLSRQVALTRELDVVANNVANTDTNGFKRRSSVFQEYISPTARDELFKDTDKRVSYVIDQGTTLNFASGPLAHTDNPLDVAIKGDALFAVQTPTGERYTRDGSFSFNAQGELVTANGHQVVTDQGVFRLKNTETGFSIAADGTISTSEGLKGRIKIVRFANIQSLNNIGSNEYSSADRPTTVANPQLEVGSIEKSNVNAILEMSRLIEINRSYQSVANMMTQTDALRKEAIQKLADITT